MGKERKPRIAVCMGDAAGIGPEVVARVLASSAIGRYCRPIVIGDRRVLEKAQRVTGVRINIQAYSEVPELDVPDFSDAPGQIPLVDLANLDPDEVEVGHASGSSGKASAEALAVAVKAALKGRVDGVAYAPLSKSALVLSGLPFSDELDYFAHLTGWKGNRGQIAVIKNLWTARVTSHTSFRSVADQITTEKVGMAIDLAYETLRRAGFLRPRIAVAALNPHAGDSGLFGREEIDVIAPAIEARKAMGLDIRGPLPADTVFVAAFRGQYDSVITMYHDQSQIPVKLMGFCESVTVNAGLPVILVTPGHGVAFDIAGRGIAKAGAMKSAILLAARMARADAAGDVGGDASSNAGSDSDIATSGKEDGCGQT